MEIMYRLPASSVAKFRIFSKDWRSLLSEPSFIKTHQVINTLNRNHHILIFKPIAASTASLSLLPFHENQHIEKARQPKNYAPFGDASDDGLDVIGCCNGLVLLSAFSFSDDGPTVFDHRLVVLNPTTRDFLELPVCSCCFDPDGCHILDFKKSFLYGFSYDSFTDDYKVVTIFYNYDVPTVPTVHVYSLRTKTWRHVIEFPYNPVHMWMSSSNAFVNGNIHRLAAKKDDYGDKPKIIVAISLADETISEVPLPDDYIMLYCYDCKVVDVGGELGIFQNLKAEVWLMNEYGVKESWTKISFQEIPRGVKPTLIYKDDDKVLVVCRDLKLIYTLDKKRRKRSS